MANTPRVSVESEDFVPVDGGFRSWQVMSASFFCHGIIFGTIQSYGVIYKKMYDDLQKQQDTSASSRAALVGSLALGTTFLGSSIAGVVSDMIGINWTVALGGGMTIGGLLLSSLFTHSVRVLYFTYGILFGLGAAFTQMPSLAILGHYFKKYLGKVNGFVTAGPAIFTPTMSYLIAWFLDSFELEWTYRLLALIFSSIFICAFIFRPKEEVYITRMRFREAVSVPLWRNKRFVIWALLLAFSLFGAFVIHVHILKFVEYNYPAESDGKIPIICMAVASGVGRLVFGTLADYHRIDRLYLQQFMYFCIGATTSMIPFTKPNFVLLNVATSILGLCNIGLLVPIAYDLCGRASATQAIGYLLAISAIPLTVGPYLAGELYDYTQSYDLAFHLSGLPSIIGSLLLFSVRCVKPYQHRPSV